MYIFLDYSPFCPFEIHLCFIALPIVLPGVLLTELITVLVTITVTAPVPVDIFVLTNVLALLATLGSID